MASEDPDRAPAATAGDGIELAQVERCVRAAQNIEEWHRDALLSSIRSLVDFYRGHVADAPQDPA